MLKVAIAGLGEISQIHLAAIRELEKVQVTAVCDIDESRLVEFENVNRYSSLEEMLDSEVLDVVHICLPHYLHLDATRQCLLKGINVFLEKPPGLDYRDARVLADLEESSVKKVCLCLQNRLNPTTMALLERLESKEAGEAVGIKALVPWYRPAEYYKSKPWRGTMRYAGGGLMINQAVHTLDIMQLIGGTPDRISALAGNLLDYTMEVEDTVAANIHFKNGIRAFFMGTNASYTNSSVDIEVFCEAGRYVLRDSSLKYFGNDSHEELIVTDVVPSGYKFYYGKSHKDLIEKFYKAIENNTDDYIHAKEGLASMAIIDGIRKAAEEHREINMEEII
ncbi:lipopolysaccharide biosynthesis protein [Youngiibacter fragilis 232.1]|uniref:Lipopolysaccharide biosynthesis protein n=1 Tax=Youngiibacter fragilis 232.1 TaxID=994573 RepID=V7IAN9_9CLOT|nr:lipopolysaccharide biosynthesis protein [Youngiibacter fragilis 232.1]